MEGFDATQAVKDTLSLTRRIRGYEEYSANVGDLMTTVEGLFDHLEQGGHQPEQWRNVRLGRPKEVEDGPVVLEGVRHGIRSSYNRGCRCTRCRAANADAVARQRANRKKRDDE